ncbi:MAG: HlyD family efflux transporter periplasmic adaptor subunit [Anaerovoracaceae bacterium]
MTKKKIRLVVLYLIAVLVLGIITIAIPQLTGALTKTEILQYENMQITDETTCYFVRNETVHTAPMAGTINYYVENGVKVRKNAKILDLAPRTVGEEETSSYTDIITRLSGSSVVLNQMNSAQNGVVCYYIDGYEGYFTPENMASLDYDKVKNLKLKTVNLTRESTLKDEPLFKICQGNVWYLIAWIDTENISKYEVGKTVKVELPLGQIKADVQQIIDQGEKWLVIMETNRYYEDFAKERTARATVITQEYLGIKVRNSSITTEDGTAGVYIKSKNGEFVFKPVNIITSDGDYSLVSSSKFYDKDGQEVSTVEVYDEILKNPSKDLSSQEGRSDGKNKEEVSS